MQLIPGAQEATVANIQLAIRYEDGTASFSQHPSKAAARRTVESYRADAVVPFIKSATLTQVFRSKPAVTEEVN